MKPSERARTPRRVALLLSLAGLIGPARAFAQGTEPFDLRWEAPAECPSADAVRRRVRELAGSLPEAGAALSAEAKVTRKSDGGLRLQLVIRAGKLQGERSIDGRTCKDLAGATAVALALLLRSPEPLGEEALMGGPSSGTDSTEGDPSPFEDPSSAGQTPAPGRTSPKSAPTPSPASLPARPERRWHGLLQLPIGSVGLGPLKQTSLGAGLAGGVMVERWRFLAEGRAWLDRHARTTSDLEEYGADLARLTATLRTCRAVLLSGLELAPCVSLSLEHLSARGTGAHIAARTADALWLAGGIGAQARLHLAPWLNLVAGVDAQLEFSRPRITLDGVGEVEQLVPVAATMTLGSEWIL